MKKTILAVCVIALFLGSAIVQAGVSQLDDTEAIESQTETNMPESEKLTLFWAYVWLSSVENLKVETESSRYTGDIGFLGIWHPTITGISKKDGYKINYVQSVLLPFKKYEYSDGEPINLKCLYLKIDYTMYNEQNIVIGKALFLRQIE